MSLSRLIHDISHLTASGKSPAEVIEQTGALIANTLEASHLDIRLWGEFHRALGSFSHGQRVSSTGDLTGLAQFSRPIEVRGIEYGWLDLVAPAGIASQSEFEMFGAIVANLLGQVAERHALRTRNTRLADEQRHLGWQVRILMLLSRAAGVLAVRRRLSSEAAMELLCDESLRLRLPVWETAERLLERETLVRVLHQETAQPMLRRTA